MFQSRETEVVDVVNPGNVVIGPGVSERYGVQPVEKDPVKSAQISCAIPLPSSSLGGLSLRGNMLTGFAVTADDIPVRTHVPDVVPVASPAATKCVAAAQKSALPSAGCQG